MPARLFYLRAVHDLLQRRRDAGQAEMMPTAHYKGRLTQHIFTDWAYVLLVNGFGNEHIWVESAMATASE